MLKVIVELLGLGEDDGISRSHWRHFSGEFVGEDHVDDVVLTIGKGMVVRVEAARGSLPATLTRATVADFLRSLATVWDIAAAAGRTVRSDAGGALQSGPLIRQIAATILAEKVGLWLALVRAVPIDADTCSFEPGRRGLALEALMKVANLDQAGLSSATDNIALSTVRELVHGRSIARPETINQLGDALGGALGLAPSRVGATLQVHYALCSLRDRVAQGASVHEQEVHNLFEHVCRVAMAVHRTYAEIDRQFDEEPHRGDRTRFESDLWRGLLQTAHEMRPLSLSRALVAEPRDTPGFAMLAVTLKAALPVAVAMEGPVTDWSAPERPTPAERARRYSELAQAMSSMLLDAPEFQGAFRAALPTFRPEHLVMLAIGELMAQGHFRQAIEVLNEARAALGNTFGILRLLAVANLELGDVEAARTFLHEALAQHPDDASAVDLLAEVERRLGNHEEKRRLEKRAHVLGMPARLRVKQAADRSGN